MEISSNLVAFSKNTNFKSALHCGMTGGRAGSEQTNGFAAIAVFHFGFRLLRAEFLIPQYYIPLAISKDKLHLED